jgi:hypothetical protein
VSVLSVLNKRLIYVPILAGMMLLVACTGSTALPASPPDNPTVTPAEVTNAPSDNSSAQTQNSSLSIPDRVDVVYFHRPQRCPSCLCFEERVRYVVSTYFQKDINTGKMTFAVYDIGDSANTDIVNKYGAVGSQLFINTVRNGSDNIEDIQKIWDWNCRGDKPGFDQHVKNIIQQSLGGQQQ